MPPILAFGHRLQNRIVLFSAYHFVYFRRVLFVVGTCACYYVLSRSFVARVLKVRAASSSHIRFMSTLPSSTLAVTAVSSDNKENFELLMAIEDAYGGVIVEMKEPMDSAAFVRSLRTSMYNWRQQGKKGIWIKLPIEHANLVHSAVQWMPIEEYAAQPLINKYELLRYTLKICLAKTGYNGFSPLPTKSSFSEHESYYLNLNSKELNQPSSSGKES